MTDDEIEIREALREIREDNERTSQVMREALERQRPLTLREVLGVTGYFLAWPFRQVVLNWRRSSGAERGMMVVFGLFVAFLVFVLLGSP